MSVLGGKQTLTTCTRAEHPWWVLDVLTKPVIEADPQSGGWQITYQLGEAFDYDIPFRAALEEVVEVLGRSAPSSLTLPPFSRDEDFVEGVLDFGPQQVGVYYEYSLGYLALMNPHRKVVEEVADKLRPHIQRR